MNVLTIALIIVSVLAVCLLVAVIALVVSRDRECPEMKCPVPPPCDVCEDCEECEVCKECEICDTCIICENASFTTKNELRGALAVMLSDWSSQSTIDAVVNRYGDMETWDVSAIADLSYLFSPEDNPWEKDDTGCHPSLDTTSIKWGKGVVSCNRWNVSGVTNMKNMFKGVTYLWADFSEWDVSQVENMRGMFEGVGTGSEYFKGFEKWYNKVGKVKYTADMFKGCGNMNADFSDWKFTDLRLMSGMFEGCSNFTGDGLSTWDFTSITYTQGEAARMFFGCSKLNVDLGNWKLRWIFNAREMFQGCSSLSGDLSRWDPSKFASLGNVVNMFKGVDYDNLNVGWTLDVGQKGEYWNGRNIMQIAGDTPIDEKKLFNTGLSRPGDDPCNEFYYCRLGITITDDNTDVDPANWQCNTTISC